MNNKNKNALLFCLSIATLCCTSLVAAEESINAPLLNETDELLLQDIPSVYSASKYDQKVTKAPASISIVTADEIKKYGYRTFSDILSSLRGFYTTNDRNYGYAGARGFGIPSDYNTRILLLINGHRFNDNVYDSFDITEGFPIDIDIIERVELVRGPSSSLYGNSAFFGVINVLTKRGRDQQGVTVKGSYGSNDTYKTNVSAGNRFSNGIETFLTGSFYNSQGNNSLYFKEFDNPATNNGFYNHNDQEQAKKLQGSIAYEDFSLQGLYVRRNKNVPTGSYNTVFNSPITETMDESAFLELKYDHTFDNQVNIQSRVSYNQYRYTGDWSYDYADYTQTDTPLLVTNKDLSIGKWWRAELEATKVLWDDHRLTIGGQYQGNFQQLQTNYDLETYSLSDVSTYQWALFFQDDYSILKNLTLNAGVRFDYFSTFGSTINPRVGLIYAPWDSTNIKLLYGVSCAESI